MSQRTILEQIQKLDPVTDHQRIVSLSTRYDFPFDTTRALEFALFRTFCVPSIAALLAGTGEFLRRTQKRYDDTDILISEMMEWGYDSPRGRAALDRMNQIHSRFPIGNDDHRYVLSTFIYEPIRWNTRFGWRPLCVQERLGYFHFWCAVGERMGIHDVPADFDAFEQFSCDYERTHFRTTEATRRIAEAVRGMFLRWFPPPLRPLARAAMSCLMDEPMRQAFDWAPPSPRLQAVVVGAMRLRAWLLRWVPASRRPQLRTAGPYRSYPHGYRIERIGPPDDQ